MGGVRGWTWGRLVCAVRLRLRVCACVCPREPCAFGCHPCGPACHEPVPRVPVCGVQKRVSHTRLSPSCLPSCVPAARLPTTAGFPLGGAGLCVTSGVVSRVEVGGCRGLGGWVGGWGEGVTFIITEKAGGWFGGRGEDGRVGGWLYQLCWARDSGNGQWSWPCGGTNWQTTGIYYKGTHIRLCVLNTSL